MHDPYFMHVGYGHAAYTSSGRAGELLYHDRLHFLAQEHSTLIAVLQAEELVGVHCVCLETPVNNWQGQY